MNIQQISISIGVIIGLTTLVGLGFKVDARYAKMEKVVYIEQRLEQKIAQDRTNYLQEQIWKIEDRYRNQQMPDEVLDRYRRLIKELMDEEDRLRKEK